MTLPTYSVKTVVADIVFLCYSCVDNIRVGFMLNKLISAGVLVAAVTQPRSGTLMLQVGLG